MIIRKPYAFLIRHFRKIHVLLLILCGYIFYKNIELNSFISEFQKLKTYDIYNEPISQIVSNWALLVTFLIIVGSISLLILLKHKKKPWILYLLPIAEYTFILIIFLVTKQFFDNYTGNLETATIRAIGDFMTIVTFIQYPAMILFLIRILGVDLNKFNFQMDQEYLEMNQEDREELEINVEFDKDSLKRGVKRLRRNLNYFYQEHKLLVNSVITVLLVLFIYNTYVFIFVTNKSYKEGQSLEANAYTITLNDSYYTDKDYNGNIISEQNAFVILDLNIKNNYSMREIDLNKFHIMNGTNNYSTTDKTYETEFHDYGKTYSKKELKNGEEFNLIMIFKVDKKLSPNRFALYYQEFNENGKPHLRKIKLELKNVSEIQEQKELTLGEPLNFTLKKKKQEIIFDEYQLLDEVDYIYRVCLSSTCTSHQARYKANPGYKILKISFASNNFEGKDMIDFSTKYGKINCIDNENKKSVVEFKNPFNRVYYGKYLYTLVPEKMTDAKSIELTYTIRNKKYTYKIR